MSDDSSLSRRSFLGGVAASVVLASVPGSLNAQGGGNVCGSNRKGVRGQVREMGVERSVTTTLLLERDLGAPSYASFA